MNLNNGKKKALFVLRHRDRLIRKYIEKKFRQWQISFSKIKIKYYSYIVLPIFILIWVYLLGLCHCVFGLLVTLFITIELLTLLLPILYQYLFYCGDCIFIIPIITQLFFQYEISYPNFTLMNSGGYCYLLKFG